MSLARRRDVLALAALWACGRLPPVVLCCSARAARLGVRVGTRGPLTWRNLAAPPSVI